MHDLEKGFYTSPRWTYEILDCSMPMTFDTYSNCAFNCQYCFSFFKRANDPATQEAYLAHKVKSVDVRHVINMFTDPDKYGGQFTYYIKNRIPMQWGGLSDGFDYYEKKFGKSLELFKFFKEINYPISISTKGTWFVKDPEYIKAIYGASNVHWKISIITLDIEKAQIIEKGVPLPMERFETLRILKDFGAGGTTLRFRPFIVGVSDDSLETMVQEAAKAKCNSVTTEFLCLESRATGTAKERFDEISRAAGFDIVEYYSKNSAKASGLMRLSYELKRPYITRFKKVCAEYDLDFFVSDAHHKGESCTAACCGLPRTPMFANYAKGHFAEALQIAKVKGYVTWEDIASHADYLKVISFIKAEGFPMDTPERAKRKYQSLYDYMHELWNTPSSFMGPAKYFSGTVIPASTDENGDIIYMWNKPYIEESIEASSVIEVLGSYSEDEKEVVMQSHSVKYPICIVSKGRAPHMTTSDALTAAGLNFWMFVPAGQAEAYDQYRPYCVPDEASLAETRQEIIAYGKMENVKKVWILDDDLIFMKPVEETLGLVEYMSDQYTNIIMASPAMENADPYPTWNIDKASPAKCMLVSTETDFPFRHHNEFPMMSHIEFQLEHLITNGWHVLVDYRNRIGTKFLPGGMNWAYLVDNGKLPQKASAILHEKYKTYTHLDSNGLLVIDWKHFSTGAMPKALHHMLVGDK